MLSAKDRFRKRLLHKLTLKTPVLFTSKSVGIWWLIAILYTFVLVLFFFGPILRVYYFDCLTNREPSCPDFVLPELEKNRGQLIYKLNLNELSQKLHTNIPTAETVKVVRSWPNRLAAEIVWQSPIASLQIPASESAILIGGNGLIMNSVDQIDPNLPVIIASDAASLVVSDYLSNDSLLTALKIIQNLPLVDNYLITRIEVISPLELRVINQNQTKYLFTATKPVETQLHALQLILAQSTIDISDPVYDLRYDRPALKQSW